MDKGAWQATVHGGAESDRAEWLTLLLLRLRSLLGLFVFLYCQISICFLKVL